MFPQENQPGNLVNVLQLSCPGDRHCSSGVRFSLSTHGRPETPTDSHTQVGWRCDRRPRVAATTGGAQSPQEKVLPARAAQARTETHWSLFAKRALKIGESTLFMG